VLVRVQQHARDSRFACPRGGGKDDQEAAPLALELVHDRSCFGRAVAVKRWDVAVHKKSLEMVRRSAYCALQQFKT
jgi:hypothetical protein